MEYIENFFGEFRKKHEVLFWIILIIAIACLLAIVIFVVWVVLVIISKIRKKQKLKKAKVTEYIKNPLDNPLPPKTMKQKKLKTPETTPFVELPPQSKQQELELISPEEKLAIHANVKSKIKAIQGAKEEIKKLIHDKVHATTELKEKTIDNQINYLRERVYNLTKQQIVLENRLN